MTQNMTPVVHAQDVGSVALINFKRIVSFITNMPTATVIHQRVAGAAGNVNAAAFTGVQNDIPRTVTVVDDGIALGNTGDVIIVGRNQYGDDVVETVAINNLGSRDSLNAFTWISQLRFPIISDTDIEIQMGDGIGVPAAIASAASIRAIAVDLAAAGAKAFHDPDADVTLDLEYDVLFYTPGGVQQPIQALDTYDIYVQG